MEFAKIKDLFDIKKGKKTQLLEQQIENSVRFIQIDDLRNNDNPKHCLYEEKSVYVYPEDIIIAWDGANAGTIGYGLTGVIGSTLAALRLKKDIPYNIDTHYLGFFLKFNQQFLRDNCTGATIPHISRNVLNELKIPIPNIDTQTKIVSILNEVISIIDKRQQQITSLSNLKQSIFSDMFGNPFINEKKWIKKTFPELVVDEKYSLKRGPFGGSLKKDMFVDKGYLVYEQYHAINDKYDLKRYFITPEKFEEMKAFRVNPGDLIISCSGVTLGRISEIPQGSDEGIINQALLKISLNNKLILNVFFINLFRNERVQKNILGISRGSGIPNFPSMKEIKKIEFICPPLKLQEEFKIKIQEIECQEVRLSASLEEMQILYSSLMQQAFKGELFQS